jgi:hypothetical protein
LNFTKKYRKSKSKIMELSGKIIKILPLQSGTGKNGAWKKQEFVVETPGQISRKVCFNIWGEKIEQFKLTEGAEVKVSFDIESREYNGKWYTDVKAWKVETVNKGADETIPEEPDDYPFGVSPAEEMPQDDLPF